MARYLALLVGLPIVLGALTASWLLVATAHELPGYDIREGVIGTRFLSSLLYSMRSNDDAMIVMCILYFCYGALAGLLIGLLVTFATEDSPDKV